MITTILGELSYTKLYIFRTDSNSISHDVYYLHTVKQIHTFWTKIILFDMFYRRLISYRNSHWMWIVVDYIVLLWRRPASNCNSVSLISCNWTTFLRFELGFWRFRPLSGRGCPEFGVQLLMLILWKPTTAVKLKSNAFFLLAKIEVLCDV